MFGFEFEIVSEEPGVLLYSFKHIAKPEIGDVRINIFSENIFQPRCVYFLHLRFKECVKYKVLAVLEFVNEFVRYDMVF